MIDIRNIVSDSVENTKKLILSMLKFALTKKYKLMSITPFDDELISKLGIFVEGYFDDIEEMLDEMRKKNIPFSDVPYQVRRKKFEPTQKNDSKK